MKNLLQYPEESHLCHCRRSLNLRLFKSSLKMRIFFTHWYDSLFITFLYNSAHHWYCFIISHFNSFLQVDHFEFIMRPCVGKGERKAMERLLPKLFSNYLARIIDFAGSGDVKLPLENTLLHKCINSKLKVFTSIQ